jgi:hypothetical protein
MCRLVTEVGLRWAGLPEPISIDEMGLSVHRWVLGLWSPHSDITSFSGSRAKAQWMLGQKVVAILGSAFLVTSLFLFRSWHRGMINWQMIISAPAGMFLWWAGMIKVYVAERDPEPSPSSLPSSQVARIS